MAWHDVLERAHHRFEPAGDLAVGILEPARSAAFAVELGGEADLDIATRSLSRAVELRPESASLHNNLGFAHERRGELEEAYLEYLEAEGRSEGDARYARNRQRIESVLAAR